jgi:enoyl-CoA hydratase/carnithine racemase
MAADMRIAAQSVRLIAGYPRIGGSPDGGLTWTLPQTIGYEQAMRFILENRTVDADEALRLGFVGEVVPTTGSLHASPSIVTSSPSGRRSRAASRSAPSSRRPPSTWRRTSATSWPASSRHSQRRPPPRPARRSLRSARRCSKAAEPAPLERIATSLQRDRRR